MKSATPPFLMGIVWTGIPLIFFSIKASQQGLTGDDFFAVPIILVGMAMLLSPLFAHRAAQRIVYAITNRRILIIRGAGTRGQNVEAYDDRFVNMIQRIDHSDGTGTVIFNRTERSRRQGKVSIDIRSIMDIHDAATVEQLIRDNFEIQPTKPAATTSVQEIRIDKFK